MSAAPMPQPGQAPGPAPAPRRPLGIWAAALGVLTLALSLAYGFFVLAVANDQLSPAVEHTIHTSTGLRFLVNGGLAVLPLLSVLLAVVAIVLGAIAISRRHQVGAGVIGVVAGVLSPWLPIVAVIHLVVTGLSWM